MKGSLSPPCGTLNRSKRNRRLANAASDGGRRLISVQAASREYGLSEDSFWRLIGNGHLPSVRPPGLRRVLLDRLEVEELLLRRWKERTR